MTELSRRLPDLPWGLDPADCWLAALRAFALLGGAAWSMVHPLDHPFDHEAHRQVVAGLHHEILHPLTGVLGALQVLKQDGIAQPDKALALTEAETEIRKIEQLIRRLPTLRRAAGTPYVGETTMLDLERSCAEEEWT